MEYFNTTYYEWPTQQVFGNFYFDDVKEYKAILYFY